MNAKRWVIEILLSSQNLYSWSLRAGRGDIYLSTDVAFNSRMSAIQSAKRVIMKIKNSEIKILDQA